MYNYLLLHCEKKQVKKFESLEEMLPTINTFAVFNGSPKIRVFCIYKRDDKYPLICEKFNEEGLADWDDDLKELLEN